jgi:hypothetical protein
MPVRNRQALLQELAHTEAHVTRLLARRDRGATVDRPTFAEDDWRAVAVAIQAQREGIAPEEPGETLARAERWLNTYLSPEGRQALKRTLAQRRYAAKRKLKTIQLSKATHARLAAYAETGGLTLDAAIDQLLAKA